MDKHGQDEPKKHVPTMKGLEKIADSHPDADLDTRYQDNKGKEEENKTEDMDTKNTQPQTP